MEVLDYIPSGWRVLGGAINHPRGYRWICNNKSRFGDEYRHALVAEEEIWKEEEQK
jgi:hypothetical protein